MTWTVRGTASRCIIQSNGAHRYVPNRSTLASQMILQHHCTALTCVPQRFYPTCLMQPSRPLYVQILFLGSCPRPPFPPLPRIFPLPATVRQQSSRPSPAMSNPTSSVHPPSPPNSSPLDAPSADHDTYDLFADVSQHGASLFELLAIPQASPPPFPSSPHSSHPSPSLHHNPADHHPTDHHPTDHPLDPTTVPPFHPPATALPTSASPHTSTSNVLTTAPVFLPHLSVASTDSTTPPTPSTKPHPVSAPINSSSRLSLQNPPNPSSKPSQPPHPLPPTPTISKKTSSSKRRPPHSSANLDESEASDSSDDASPSVSSKQNPANTPANISNQISNTPTNSANRRGVETSASHEFPAVKHTHNSHTRRCRAKVNSKFQELLGILPTPPPKTGIKHKAQILDYTIRVFRDIHARKTQLEADLALSSRGHLNAWVNNIVSRSVSLQDVLAPFLSLICTKGCWKYSEAWVTAQEPQHTDLRATSIEGASMDRSAFANMNNFAIGPNSKLRLGLAVIPSLGNTDDPDLHVKLERFRDRSRPYGCKARIDLPGRIMCTMRPEWLPSLEDNEAFQRARLATDATLSVCFGIPIFVRGHVAAVAMFFDTEQRAYDAKCVDLADNVAALLGSAFGASTLRKSQCR